MSHELHNFRYTQSRILNMFSSGIKFPGKLMGTIIQIENGH